MKNKLTFEVTVESDSDINLKELVKPINQAIHLAIGGTVSIVISPKKNTAGSGISVQDLTGNHPSTNYTINTKKKV